MDIIRFSQLPFQPEDLAIDNCIVTTVPKCFGVYGGVITFQHMSENIRKSRKAFFAFGKIEAFQGTHCLPSVSTKPLLSRYFCEVLTCGCLITHVYNCQEVFKMRLKGELRIFLGERCPYMSRFTCLVLMIKLKFLAEHLTKPNTTSSRILICLHCPTV